MSPSTPAPQYRDIDSLTGWVRNFIYLQLILAVVALWSGALEHGLLADIDNGSFASQAALVAAAEANDNRQLLVGIGQILVWIVSGVLILRWIYRANQNARALGADGMRFSPGWSVGWYFVPIAAMWKPYQAMKEIWRASHAPADWQNLERGAVLPWWWFFWLLSSLLGNASFRLAMQADTMDQLAAANAVTLASDLASIPLAIVSWSLISAVHAAQRRHAAPLLQGNGHGLPA